MRITAKEHGEAARRFRHLRPARSWRARCGAACTGTAHRCTRERGHRGPHVAHAAFGRVVAVWEPAPGGVREGALESRRETRPGPRRPRRPSRRNRVPGWGAFLRYWLTRPFHEPELFVLLILFLAFVGFSIHWIVLIMG